MWDYKDVSNVGFISALLYSDFLAISDSLIAKKSFSIVSLNIM